MLERFICLKQIVNDIVHRHVSAPAMVSAKEIQDISDIIDILRPVEAAACHKGTLCPKICNDKYGDSNDVYTAEKC